MKKRFLLVALISALLLALGLLSACRPAMPEVLSTYPPPETTAYVPKELVVEYYNYSSSNMSAWQKYPNDSTEAETEAQTPTEE